MWQSQIEAQKYSESLFFLTSLNSGSPGKNWYLFKQLFLIKAIKWDKYYQRLFSLQNEPHRTKLSFPVVLKHFQGYSLKTSLFNQKYDYLRKKLRKNLKICFSVQVWKKANPEENLDFL